MDCGMTFIKYSLFVFNLLFFIAALVLIGVGAYVEIEYRNVAQLTGAAISVAPIILICVGVFIMFIAFFGCCGAYKENHCMVATFAALMIIVFILEFAAAITGFALRNKIERYVYKAVEKEITEYPETLRHVFDLVQRKFECCGGGNYTDWSRSSVFLNIANRTIRSENITTPATYLVPDSCCVSESTACGLSYSTISAIHTNGCVKKIEDYIKRHALIIGGVGLAVAFLQITGIVFAFCLMRTIKKQYETV